MGKRVYHTEEEYRTAVLRDNETLKLLSGISGNLAAVLVVAASARAYGKGYLEPEVGGWFLIACFLIVAAVVAVRSLQSER
jgi:hypothetical protein